jgi:hypothetical protein
MRVDGLETRVNRQKILFLIVLGVAALFVAAIAASMFTQRQALPFGYRLSIGDKGETWIQSTDRRTLVTDVTSVWMSPEQILIERRPQRGGGSHAYEDCSYLVAGASGAPQPISKAETLKLIESLERRTGSAHTCIR